MMTSDDKDRHFSLNNVGLILWIKIWNFPNTSCVERKEQIEKIEEKERLEKEKEEKERKEAELAAQPGNGTGEEKTDGNGKVGGSTDGEEMPGVSQDDEILDENEHHDETGRYKDLDTDEVSSSLVNWNRFVSFHLVVFCFFFLHIQQVKESTHETKVYQTIRQYSGLHWITCSVMRSWNKIWKFQYVRCVETIFYSMRSIPRLSGRLDLIRMAVMSISSAFFVLCLSFLIWFKLKMVVSSSGYWNRLWFQEPAAEAETTSVLEESTHTNPTDEVRKMISFICFFGLSKSGAICY